MKGIYEQLQDATISYMKGENIRLHPEFFEAAERYLNMLKRQRERSYRWEKREITDRIMRVEFMISYIRENNEVKREAEK